MAPPYLVPYLPTIPTFLVLLAIGQFNIIKSSFIQFLISYLQFFSTFQFISHSLYVLVYIYKLINWPDSSHIIPLKASIECFRNYNVYLSKFPPLMFDLAPMTKLPPTPSRKVYVCFLPTNLTETEVKEMFKKFGTITLFQFNQRKDGFTYAHITYESVLQAQNAIIGMHKMKLQDKVLNVTFAIENCAPKWKKIQDINQQNKVLEPPQTQESAQNIWNIGRKASKKTIKREKQRQRARLRKLFEGDANPLDYLEKVEEALKDILKLKQQLIEIKEQQKNKNKKKQEVKPAEENKPEKEKESKISMVDLNVFKSWLKSKQEDEKKVDQDGETEWDDAIEIRELEENQIH